MIGNISVVQADCRDAIKSIADCIFDSCVTDPPYALVSITKRFGKDGAAPAKGNDAYQRASSGFMGQKWDTGETAFDPDFWREVLRVLKPGAHLVAFSGTRTYHRMACAIEDAGFEIRDMLQYLYGSGFPKSHNVKKGAAARVCQCEAVSECDVRSMRNANVSPSIDIADKRREILQPSVPQQSSSRAMPGTESAEGPERISELGLEGRRDLSETPRQLCEREICKVPAEIPEHGSEGRVHYGTSAGDGGVGGSSFDKGRNGPSQRPQAVEQSEEQSGTMAGQSQPQTGGTWSLCGRCGKPIVPAGLGTALKPACEPIVLARKPLSEKTVAANVLRWGTGALNIAGTRIGTRIGTRTASTGEIVSENVAMSGANYGRIQTDEVTVGRWPANVIHDGSEEVLADFPETTSGTFSGHRNEPKTNGIYGSFDLQDEVGHIGDSGSAARYFYTAKADADDRFGSKHPTVKPIDLMRWLVRLVTPPRGMVLEPFAGSGTTGVACIAEGLGALLIEREDAFVADIKARLDFYSGKGPMAAQVKVRKKPQAGNAGLFEGWE